MFGSIRNLSSIIRRRSPGLRWLALVAVGGVALLSIGTAHLAQAARTPHPPTLGRAQRAQSGVLQPFPATGLPAGPAMVVPTHTTFPAGLKLKHVHGGPTYVYVVSGSLDIIEEDGTTTTYGAGSFFSEGPGHIHTVSVPQGVEIFELQFLPPGAESIVPVQ